MSLFWRLLVLLGGVAGCGGGRGIEPAEPPRQVVPANPADGPSGPPDLRKLAQPNS